MISGISRQNNVQARPAFGSTEFVGKWGKAESHIQKAIIDFASQDTVLEPINRGGFHGLGKVNGHEPHITAHKKSGYYLLKYFPLGEKSKAKREIGILGDLKDITADGIKKGLAKSLEDIKEKAISLSRALPQVYPSQEKAIEKGKIVEHAAFSEKELIFWPRPPKAPESRTRPVPNY